MRFFSVLGLLASLWLSGCSAPPRSEEVDALGDEDPRLVWVEHTHRPDRVPVPAAPRLEAPTTEPSPSAVGLVHPKVSATIDEIEEGTWALQDLSAIDMPAIDVDTGIVVVPQLEILQLSTIVGWFEVSWLDPSGANESFAIVGEPHEVRRSVREVNAKLRASRWRAMERLAVEIPGDDYLEWDLQEPPGERRVQAFVQRGELIVRIHGVRVLERHQLDLARVMPLYRVYADRDSGTVLAIFMACTGEDCTCDPAFAAQVMKFDEATFAAVDRRPCSDCEPTDYGFNDGDPWD